MESQTSKTARTVDALGLRLRNRYPRGCGDRGVYDFCRAAWQTFDADTRALFTDIDDLCVSVAYAATRGAWQS